MNEEEILQYHRTKKLFLAVLEQPADQRAVYLERACPDDPELRDEVAGLIVDQEKLPPTPPLGLSGIDVEACLPSPERIGPFKILDEIGRGGMGVVYLAERDKPRQRVALKVIKLGMDTKAVLARFEAEQEALALMEHPGVARMYQAGATPEGQPYFAMEYVQGLPITKYCDEHRLNTTKRLKLFIDVCHAVQHAHQKGIIHRDLKPSNVLVTEKDDKPLPKVIDFGVAKSTVQRMTEQTLFTQDGQFVGTPEYMSPEQAGEDTRDIDMRTDVYSLGVLLYELLTGAMPFELRSLRRAALGEIQRIIREEEPQKPSNRLSGLGGESSTIAKKRRTSRRNLERQIRGDLDVVTMKALEKDRTRRYPTATDFAADITRHLNHEPVVAEPPGAVHRLRKFVRRNRAVVLATSSVIVVLLVGVSMSLVFAIKERNARQAAVVQTAKAEREAKTAQGIKDYLVSIFEKAKPGGALSKATLPQSLDESVKALRTAPLADLELQSELLDTIGNIYYGYTRYEDADDVSTEALDIRRSELGDLDPKTLSSITNVALTRQKLKQWDEAEKLHREAVAGLRSVLGNDDVETLSAINNLATLYMTQGRLSKAAPLLREARGGFEKLFGPEDRHCMVLTGNLAWVQMQLGQLDEAAATFRHLLYIVQRTLPENNPDRLMTLRSLVSVYIQLNQLDKAESLLRRCPYADQYHLSDPPVFSGALLKARADLYAKQDKLAAAESDYRFVIPIFDSAKNPSLENSARNGLALVLRTQGSSDQYTEAESIWLSLMAGAQGQDNPASQKTLENARKELAKLYSPNYMNAPKKLRELKTPTNKGS